MYSIDQTSQLNQKSSLQKSELFLIQLAGDRYVTEKSAVFPTAQLSKSCLPDYFIRSSM